MLRAAFVSYRDVDGMQLDMSVHAVGCSAGQVCVWALHLYPGAYVDRRIGQFRSGLGIILLC